MFKSKARSPARNEKERFKSQRRSLREKAEIATLNGTYVYLVCLRKDEYYVFDSQSSEGRLPLEEFGEKERSKEQRKSLLEKAEEVALDGMHLYLVYRRKDTFYVFNSEGSIGWLPSRASEVSFPNVIHQLLGVLTAVQVRALYPRNPRDGGDMRSDDASRSRSVEPVTACRETSPSLQSLTSDGHLSAQDTASIRSLYLDADRNPDTPPMPRSPEEPYKSQCVSDTRHDERNSLRIAISTPPEFERGEEPWSQTDRARCLPTLMPPLLWP